MSETPENPSGPQAAIPTPAPQEPEAVLSVPLKEGDVIESSGVHLHPEVKLALLMRDYKANNEAREATLAQVKAEMDALTSRVNVLAMPYEVTQKDLYGKIEALALERGAKMLEADEKAKTAFICESGKITYFRPGIKRSWELDPLDRVCNSDPYIKERIWCFRNEAPILPRIQLKVEV